MLAFTATLTDTQAGRLLDRLEQRLTSAREIADTLAAAGEAAIRDHLVAEYVPRRNRLGGPSTGFWRKAVESIDSEAQNDGSAVVRIHARGVAAHYYGATITPGKTPSTRTGQMTRALSIPTSAASHGKSPHELGDLLFRPASKAKSGGNVIGYLFRKLTRPRKRGKGGPVAYAGKMMFVLKRSTQIPEDKNVLPPQAATEATLAESIDALLTD